jgi:hypothetical protein
VKVLIRKIGTQLYLDTDQWVDLAQAHDFKSTSDAITFALEQKLSGFEIVHAFSESQYDFSSGPLDFSVTAPPVSSPASPQEQSQP